MASSSYFLAAAAAPPSPTIAGSAGLLLLFLIVSLIYFIPTIIAWVRQHPKKLKITGVNTFLGWTGIGYFITLAWSLKKIRPVEGKVEAAPVLVAPTQTGLIQEVYSVSPPPPVTTVLATPVSAPTQDDVERLAKLGALYEKGLLNSEEFQKAKAKVIGI